MDLRILVSRADRIGDLVLTLPAIAWIKASTGAKITLHCSAYAKDIGRWAQHNGIVDDLLWRDPETQTFVGPVQASAFLSFFHGSEVRDFLKAHSFLKSVGTRTKLSALWTYGHSVAQHRSKARVSEMTYNLELAQSALDYWKMSGKEFQGLPALRVPLEWREGFEAPRGLVVSLSNGGSAQNWTVGDYLRWVQENAEGEPVDFLVSGVDAALRREELKKWTGFTPGLHRVVESLPSVGHLVGFLSQASRLVASSTGPLHIAHAAGVDVLGIYPTSRAESFRRWRPDGYWHRGELKWIEME